MKRAPSFKLFLILTAFSVIGGGFLVYMQYTQLGDEQAKVDQLRSEIKNESELKKMLADSADRLKGTRERLAHLERGVPDYAYLATMLKDLEVTGRKNGVMILGVNSKVRPKQALAEGEKEERKPYIEQDIEVAGRGSYRDILNFVRALNSFPKIVETRCVTVQPKSKADGDKALDMTIEIRAFLFPEKQKAPDSKTAMRGAGVRHES